MYFSLTIGRELHCLSLHYGMFLPTIQVRPRIYGGVIPMALVQQLVERLFNFWIAQLVF